MEHVCIMVCHVSWCVTDGALVSRVLNMYVTWTLRVLVSKALQDFDLALRGKKKREKFLKDGKKKEMTVSMGWRR